MDSYEMLPHQRFASNLTSLKAKKLYLSNHVEYSFLNRSLVVN